MAVRLDRDGAVGIIVLDRPPANSYDYDFLRELGSAVDDARYDDELRAVVVVSASERFFSAAREVTDFQGRTDHPQGRPAPVVHEFYLKVEDTAVFLGTTHAAHAK